LSAFKLFERGFVGFQIFEHDCRSFVLIEQNHVVCVNLKSATTIVALRDGPAVARYRQTDWLRATRSRRGRACRRVRKRRWPRQVRPSGLAAIGKSFDMDHLAVFRIGRQPARRMFGRNAGMLSALTTPLA
jgi:hypothetical protein